MTKKATKAIADGALTLTFANDAIVAIALGDLPDSIKSQLAMHGLSQKVGDSYAGAETIDKAVACAAKVVEDLKAGNWTMRVAGSGPRITLLIEAIARIAGKTIEETSEVINELDDEQKKALRKAGGVKKVRA